MPTSSDHVAVDLPILPKVEAQPGGASDGKLRLYVQVPIQSTHEFVCM